MKKGPNSKPGIESDSFRLPRKKILRGRKNFQRLFDPEARVLRGTSTDFRFRIYKEAGEECRIGFIVKKKLGKAAKRNRGKRLLREVYRLNQHILVDLCNGAEFGLHGVFMAKTVNSTMADIEQDVIDLLKKTREYLLSITTSDL